MNIIPCRIGLLAEDSLLIELLAESLSAEEGLEVVLATADPSRLADPEVALEVVVTDLALAEAARLRTARPNLGLVLLADGPAPAELGPRPPGPAVVYADRSLGRAELLRAIRAAAPQASPGEPAPSGGGEVNRLARLTPRQLQVLAAVGLGQDNATIAGQLGITPRTVKAHLALLYRQLSASNRVQLALLAQRHRLRPPNRAAPAAPPPPSPAPEAAAG